MYYVFFAIGKKLWFIFDVLSCTVQQSGNYVLVVCSSRYYGKIILLFCFVLNLCRFLCTTLH